ncbi:MAG: DUF262 domain-containing protein, partial [Pirellulales bacterium]
IDYYANHSLKPSLYADQSYSSELRASVSEYYSSIRRLRYENDPGVAQPAATGHLNLEPGFQRKSVWTLRDRRKFIESVLEQFPVPSIFL